MRGYRIQLKPFSRELRTNLTDVEQKLWSRIRRKQLLGYQFYRQRPIGRYIVDFYCPSKRLVIELDGGQHYGEKGEAKDVSRDTYLASQKLTVLRFSNRDILENLDGAITKILQQLTSEISPNPSLPKEGDTINASLSEALME